MFTVNYLRRCYGKRMYMILILFLLDIISSLYSAGNDHLFIRHMFIAYDFVSTCANILFWFILFLPIAIDIIQDRDSFGIALYCRASKTKYLMKKSFSILVYCISFFAISMLISLLVAVTNNYPVGTANMILKLYVILVLLSYAMMELMVLISWISNSSYIMTIIYAVLITASQIPGFNDNSLLGTLFAKWHLSVLVLVLSTIVLMPITLYVIKKQDFLGIKKGTSI